MREATERRFYTIIDRDADYILVHFNGFAQRCSNLSALAKAVSYAEQLKQEPNPQDIATRRVLHDLLVSKLRETSS